MLATLRNWLSKGKVTRSKSVLIASLLKPSWINAELSRAFLVLPRFLLYINDFPHYILKSLVNSYADNTTVYKSSSKCLDDQSA